jgi:tripartite-type tricarboxylate transporter receptor subunit TctC
VPIPPGGAPDVVARLVGNQLSQAVGQPVVIENRTGANGNIAGEAAAKATPDGYTLILAADSGIVINPHVYAKMSFDPMKDLVPITSVATNQFVLAVNPKVPVKTLPEFVDYAKKANPLLSFASGGVGSQHYFAMEQLKQRAGFNVLNVTYRGGSPAMQATIAGETQVLFAGGESAGQFKAGTLRPLAVSGKERSKAMPDVPTIGETYPGYAVDIWLGLFAPAGTPQPIIDKLRTIVQAELKKPDVAAKVNVSGSLMPLVLSPEEFAARIKSDDQKFGKLAKDLNVHIQ